MTEREQSHPFLFHRPDLAARYVDALLGIGPFDRSSGLFLAGPRRTGKTTFIQNDLLVELRKQGVICTYVDLWANRQQDPAVLIADALAATLRDLEGGSMKAIRRTGLSKLGVGNWISFDLTRIGTPEGATMTEVFRAIVGKYGRPAALVIDEAQHALTTEAGVNTMFALKAARDALNTAATDGGPVAGPRLLLAFTGSHRDKLSNLVLRRAQPFYGAEISDFPRLGRDFADAYTAWLNERLAADNQFQPDDVWAAFAALGQRPELLRRVLEGAAFSEGKAASLKQALEDGALAIRRQAQEEFEGEYAALNLVQQAVLQRMAEIGANFVPFSATSLAAYSAAVGHEVTASEAQGALDALRERGLVWRSARATYALEDQDFSDWIRGRTAGHRR